METELRRQETSTRQQWPARAKKREKRRRKEGRGNTINRGKKKKKADLREQVQSTATNMSKGLQHVSYTKKMRKLGLFFTVKKSPPLTVGF